ncbi:2415_t:CDS:1, partial [Diversispora eburnea]
MPIYQYDRSKENNNDLIPPNILTQLQSPSSPTSNKNNNSTIIISRVNTPSTSTLSGLTKNISRHSSPKFESVPRILTGFTAQVQSSDSPLRQEFRNSIKKLTTTKNNYNNGDGDNDDDI